MAEGAEKKEEVVYKADPFAFIFRELDIIHADVREIKAELININKRLDNFIFDVNKRFDDVNKRFDRLYLIVILNLIGIVSFLLKEFFF